MTTPIDPKGRVTALAYLSAYLRYKNWYVKFLYEFQGDVPIGLLGVLAGNRAFFDKLGNVAGDFYSSQDEVRAKATVRMEIPDENKADELLAYILGHFNWHMLEYYEKGGKTCGLILGKRELVEEAAKEDAQEELENEKEAPKAERPKLKEEAFVNEKGMLLYWN